MHSTELTTASHVTSLLRHFADLRDGRHGDATSRQGKEAVFAGTVELLDPVARQALTEINETLLLDSGTIEASGLVTDSSGTSARWTLGWPEQRRAGIQQIVLLAFYGSGFHHPHVRGGTVGDWPLNVFTAEEAAGELPTLRAIASADLHNLVFQADFRIVPAMHGSHR